MQKRGTKRKQSEIAVRSSAPIKTKDPYPEYPRPSPEECRAVRDDLLNLHGFPQEFVKYQRNQTPPKPEAFNGENSGEENESVLDGLVSTILSQNTTDANSRKAFASLKSLYPTWQNVVDAEMKHLENAIRCGGLAPTKAACIKNLLNCLLEKKGKLCLEYLRDLSVDEIKKELSQFKGIGPKRTNFPKLLLAPVRYVRRLFKGTLLLDFPSFKLPTVACVLMFNLQRDDFPVDTHVLQIAKAIGWVPAVADTKKTYLHLNQRIPDELKFDLNCLLFTHGKICKKCTSKRCNEQKFDSDSCPLLNYV